MLLLRQLSNATNWSITKKNSEHSCIAAVILRLIFTTSFLVTPSKIWLISVLTWLSSLCVFFLSSSAYDEKLDWCLYFCHLKFMTNFLVMMGRKLAPGATEFVVKSVWHNYSTKRFTMQKRLRNWEEKHNRCFCAVVFVVHFSQGFCFHDSFSVKNLSLCSRRWNLSFQQLFVPKLPS